MIYIVDRSSMESAFPTAQRPGKMQVDVDDGVGGWSEEL